MAWEERKGNLYYYSKQRIGNKVVSRYVGKGPLAELHANAIQEAIDRRQSIAKDRIQWAQIEQELANLKKEIDRQLKANGLHRQNWGPWRRKRGS